MKFVHTYKKGLIGGFLFGTIGILLVAMFSMLSPLIETVAMPLLWPGRFMAAYVTESGQSMSSWMVAVLYIFTGIFYAIIGMILQMILRMVRR